MKTTNNYQSDREILLEILKYNRMLAEKKERPAKPTLQDIGYINNDDLMTMFKVKRGTTTMWRNTGILHYTKIGGMIYYKLSDVIDMMNKHFQSTNIE